ncbi:hypothetical protein [Marmoricola sp. URHB0036]|uniref:hypothetical protein n=1 Tax=Marmoricola sp. URHB0036 TaxID=1298863 RepID=UPI00040499C4|nr:hypothetical protein [Marmoricola sp. URHB0036]
MNKATLLAPLSAVLLLAGLFETNVATHSSDRVIADWLAHHGDGSWIIHALAEVVAGCLLLVYAQVLRARLGGGDDTLTRTLGALGTLVASMVVVGAGLFAAIPIGRVFEHSPDPDPSAYRYLMAASASILVIFVSVPAAAFAATAAVLGLRRGTAPRWLGYVGLGLAALMLISAFVAPLMVFGLWLFVTGISLAMTRAEHSDVPTPVAVH